MSEYVIEIPDTIERRTVSSKDAFSLSMLTGLPVREEIIRCRDCKKSSSVTAQGEPCPDGMLDCSHFAKWDYYDDKPGVCLVEYDGHCAWAVRRQ